MSSRFALALFALGLAACDRAAPIVAANTQQIALSGRVIDRAGVLDAASEAKIVALSETLESRTSDQLVVVTLDSLNGASIEQVGYALGNSWGVGRKDLDNGVLLLVAPVERRVRVEVGTGLEGLLTDAKSAEVVRGMLPSFQQKDYGAGVTHGASAISDLLSSDPKRPQPRGKAG